MITKTFEAFYLNFLFSDGEPDGDAAVVEGLLEVGDGAVVDAHLVAELGAADEVFGRQIFDSFQISIRQLKKDDYGPLSVHEYIKDLDSTLVKMAR